MIALFPVVLGGREDRLMILVLPSVKRFQFFHAASSPDDLKQDTSFSLILNSLLFDSSEEDL